MNFLTRLLLLAVLLAVLVLAFVLLVRWLNAPNPSPSGAAASSISALCDVSV